MSDYGIGLSSNNRKLMKSPGTSGPNFKNIDQMKHLKKKYQEAKESLALKQQQNTRLEKKLDEMKLLFLKREKQLEKKDSIHEILLQQIKVLQGKKQQFYLQSNKSLKSLTTQTSQEKIYQRQYLIQKQRRQNLYSTTSQQSSKEISCEKIGGYFSKVFK